MPGSNFPANIHFEGDPEKGNAPRRFSEAYYNAINSLGEHRHKFWLGYSYRKNYVYCQYCWLLGEVEARKSPWASSADDCQLRDWKHLSEKIQKHSSSKAHLNSISAYVQFLREKCVDNLLLTQISEEARRWNDVLTVQFHLIRVMASLGLSFRGHSGDINDTNCGVYLTLLKLIATRDAVLAEHLSGESRIKYLSKTITNEQIQILAGNVRNHIINSIKKAKFWVQICDSTTDISHIDQLAYLVRYVDVDYDSKTINICESFLDYLPVKDASADGLLKLITKYISDKGLQLRYLRGQAYDGASVISGSDGGLNALLINYVVELKDKELEDEGNQTRPVFLPYVHCPPHQVNLVLQHAAEKNAPVTVVSFFGFVQKIYKFMSKSNRRWDKLLDCLKEGKSQLETIVSELNEENLRNGNSEPDGLGTKTKLPRSKVLKACAATRWTSRVNATDALIKNFGCVVDCLADIIDERHNIEEVKIAQDLQANIDFQFMLLLLVWHRILTLMDTLSRYLQSKQIDLFMVVDLMKDALNEVMKLRSEEQYDLFVAKSRSLWSKHGLPEEEAVFKEKRVRRTKRMVGEQAVDDDGLTSAAVKFRVEVYYKTLDNIIGELGDRTNGIEVTAKLFGFLHPKNLKKISTEGSIEQTDRLVKQFPKYFTAALATQIENFSRLYFKNSLLGKQQQQEQEQRGVLQYLQFLVEKQLCDTFPEVEILCRLFLTLPIGIASAERAFSVLRRTKNYLRSSLAQEMLSSLALLCIESNVSLSLDLSEIIKEFANAKARRGAVLV